MNDEIMRNIKKIVIKIIFSFELKKIIFFFNIFVTSLNQSPTPTSLAHVIYITLFFSILF